MHFSETVRQTVLPSGVTVITDTYKAPGQEGLMGAAIVAHVGSLHDPVGKNGLAHMAEHMLAKAVPGMSGDNFLCYMDGLGLNRSGLSTGPHDSVYHARGPITATEKYLDLISRALHGRAYTAAHLDAERDIINEMEDSLTNPGNIASLLFHKAAFRDQPHAKWQGGFPKDLAALQISDIDGYHRRGHVTGNLTLVTSGGCHDQACDWAERNLSTLEPGPRIPRLSSKLHYPHHSYFHIPYFDSDLTGPMVGFQIHYPTEHLIESERAAVGLANSTFHRDLQRRAKSRGQYSLYLEGGGLLDQSTISLSGSAVKASNLRQTLGAHIVDLHDALETMAPDAFERQRQVTLHESNLDYRQTRNSLRDRFGSLLNCIKYNRSFDTGEQYINALGHAEFSDAKSTAMKVYGQLPIPKYVAASENVDFPGGYHLQTVWKNAGKASIAAKASCTSPATGAAPTP